MRRLIIAFAVVAFIGPLLSGQISQAGSIVYVCDHSGNIGAVDVDSGTVTDLIDVGTTFWDIAFDPDGNLYGLTGSTLYSVNRVTSSVQAIGEHGIPAANAFVIHPDGTAYAAGENSTSLYTVNLQTGAATAHHDTGKYANGDLAFHGGRLYMTTKQKTPLPATYYLVDVDLTGGGTAREVMQLPEATFYGMDTADDGNLYVFRSTYAYSVDLINETLTPTANWYRNGLNLAYGASTPIPEPSTVASLLSLGIVGLIGYWWRRRKAA